jgi:hypothetical protein
LGLEGREVERADGLTALNRVCESSSGREGGDEDGSEHFAREELMDLDEELNGFNIENDGREVDTRLVRGAMNGLFAEWKRKKSEQWVGSGSAFEVSREAKIGVQPHSSPMLC